MLVKQDVLIIGGGIAGLYTALALPEHLSIGILMKGRFSDNNSYLAQGGIAVCTEAEDVAAHIQDTLIAGGEKCNPKAVSLLVQQGRFCLDKLVAFGVPFDRTTKGELEKTKEGGHSTRRIFHAHKDATGRALIQTLYEVAQNRPNIKIYDQTFATELIVQENNQCAGVYALSQNQTMSFQAKITLLATGGIGQLYKHTTNPKVATGDGIAMAARAGVELRDMEFVQFHPTVFFQAEAETNQRFLISEAVRGEGAYLRNAFGERFMLTKHPLKELAPRDIVARAIFAEIKRTESNFVYLDLSHKESSFIRNRFPNIYRFCLTQNIDITKQFIPITPAQHYFMGGIAVDLKGRTSMKGLYACGECANTGVHGGNRLASNSLLEAVVFGEQIAKDISRKISSMEEPKEALPAVYHKKQKSIESLESQKYKEELQEIMRNWVGIVRKRTELQQAKKKIDQMLSSVERSPQLDIECYELYNMLMVAKGITKAALARKQSCGSHYVEVEGEQYNELVFCG